MKTMLAGGAAAALLLGVTAPPALADGMPRQRVHQPRPPVAARHTPRRHHPAPAPRVHEERYEHSAPEEHRRYHAEEVEVSEHDTGWVGDREEVRVFRGAPQGFEMRRYEHHEGGEEHEEGYEDDGYEERYARHGAAHPYTYGYGAWSGYYAGGHRLVGERYWDRQVGPECHGGPVGHGGYERRCYMRREHGAALPYGFGDSGVGFGVAEGSAFTGGGGTVIIDSRSSSSASASAFARSNAFAYGRGGGHHGRPGHHGGGRPGGHHGGGHHGGHGGHGGR